MCYEECEKATMDYAKFLLLPLKTTAASIWNGAWWKSVVAFIVSAIAFLLHENVMGVGVLIGLVIIDQISGVWIAVRTNSFNSSAFRNGLIKLLFYCIILGAFHSLQIVNETIFVYLKLDTGALTWLTITEIVSIVENSCILIDIPFPNWILDKLRLFISFGKWKLKSDNKNTNSSTGKS